MASQWVATNGVQKVTAPSRPLAIIAALAKASTNPNYRWPHAERDGWRVEQIT
jgi:hypothetical protein